MQVRARFASVLVGALSLTFVPAVTASAETTGGECTLWPVEASDIVTLGTKATDENVGMWASCTYEEVCDADGWCEQVPVADDRLRVTGQFRFADGSVSKLWSGRAVNTFDYNFMVTRPFSYRDPAGRTTVTARLFKDGVVVDTVTDPFTVRRNAKIDGLNAGPEDRLVNSNLKTSGKLTRLTETGKYVAWGNKTVYIQFKAVGGVWTDVGTDVTSSTGYFEKVLRTKRDGHWRAWAARTNYTGEALSAADYVNVTNYKNCSAVPASVRPLTRTEPGYEPRLDADSDGLACE